MKNKFFSILFVALVISCGKPLNEAEQTFYYVRYMAEPITDIDRTVAHDIVLTLPWGEDGLFHTNDSFDESYGPFKCGTTVHILADTPHLDTYKVQIRIRKGEDGLWNLVGEGLNQAQFTIPDE